MTRPFRFVTLKSNVNFDSRIFRSSKTPLSKVPAWGLHTIFSRMNNECNRKAFCYVQQTLEPAPYLPPPLPPPLKSTPVVYADDNPRGYCVRMSASSFSHCIKSCILTESFGACLRQRRRVASIGNLRNPTRQVSTTIYGLLSVVSDYLTERRNLFVQRFVIYAVLLIASCDVMFLRQHFV